ncbi:hypothetical protein BT69DRAFT_1304795 [Atractiella rhizophila]|nr:hypothetical protein BT69DRAFT_1304795 [Atractiella rhizophila]
MSTLRGEGTLEVTLVEEVLLVWRGGLGRMRQLAIPGLPTEACDNPILQHKLLLILLQKHLHVVQGGLIVEHLPLEVVNGILVLLNSASDCGKVLKFKTTPQLGTNDGKENHHIAPHPVTMEPPMANLRVNLRAASRTFLNISENLENLYEHFDNRPTWAHNQQQLLQQIQADQQRALHHLNWAKYLRKIEMYNLKVAQQQVNLSVEAMNELIAAYGIQVPARQMTVQDKQRLFSHFIGAKY